MAHTIPFTKSGYDNLKKKLDILLNKRPDAVKTLSRAREMGDLSENGLYKAAKFELSDIDREVRFLKNLIKYGKIIGPSNNNTVQIGHNVEIENEKGKKTYQIVGEYEANPNINKISYKSPIGFSLLGKKVEDKINIKTPTGVLYYLIKNISL